MKKIKNILKLDRQIDRQTDRQTRILYRKGGSSLLEPLKIECGVNGII